MEECRAAYRVADEWFSFWRHGDVVPVSRSWRQSWRACSVVAPMPLHPRQLPPNKWQLQPHSAPVCMPSAAPYVLCTRPLQGEAALIANKAAAQSQIETGGGPLLRAQSARWLCFGAAGGTAPAALRHANLLCRDFALGKPLADVACLRRTAQT